MLVQPGITIDNLRSVNTIFVTENSHLELYSLIPLHQKLFYPIDDFYVMRLITPLNMG